MRKGHDPRAVRFQRLVFGTLLLFAFIFKFMPLAVVVGMLMLTFSLLPVYLSPFYRFYFVLKSQSKQEPSCDPGQTRFACGMGTVFLGLAFLFHFLHHNAAAWALVFMVATLSLLAGTTGFCLGNLIYAWLKRWF